MLKKKEWDIVSSSYKLMIMDNQQKFLITCAFANGIEIFHVPSIINEEADIIVANKKYFDSAYYVTFTPDNKYMYVAD